jgi:tripartite-type tricarboxylate transporter receptor subunit TctC
MTIRKSSLVIAALWAASVAIAGPAAAAEYPSRPITFVVGLGAGGGQDVNSRIYADAMSRILHENIVVENRTGAGGGLAAAYVQNAAPDGYTLLTISGLQHFYVPIATQPGMYEPIKGFAPVSLLFEIVSTLTVPEEMPVKDAADFVAYGKKKPHGLTVGSPGQGSPPHMFGVLINEATGVPVQAIQYRGSTQAMTDLSSGIIDFAFPTYTLGKPFIDQGKVRPIAVAAEKRWSLFPDLPTLKEAGLVKEMVAMWFGLVAPAGTPAPIIAKLNDAAVKASHDPELVKRLNSTGTTIRTSTPEDMRTMMASESAKVVSLVDRLGLRPH